MVCTLILSTTKTTNLNRYNFSIAVTYPNMQCPEVLIYIANQAGWVASMRPTKARQIVRFHLLRLQLTTRSSRRSLWVCLLTPHLLLLLPINYHKRFNKYNISYHYSIDVDNAGQKLINIITSSFLLNQNVSTVWWC